MISIRTYLQFLIDNKLTQAEFMFIMFVHNKNDLHDIVGDYIQKVCFGELLPKTMIEDLVSDGWITKLVENPNTLAEFSTTVKVSKHFINLYDDSNEFWQAYPPIIRSGDKVLSLTIMDKNVYRKLYGEKTGYAKKNHFEMMEDLKYGLENGLINMKIENYLNSEYYLTIRKMRKSEGEKENIVQESNDF